MNTGTLKNLLQKLSSFGLETLELFKPKQRQDFATHIQSLCQSLLGLSGEAASIAIAEEIIRSYRQAGNDDKAAFFHYLHAGLAADPDKIDAAIKTYQATPNQTTLQQLAGACAAPRLELLRTLNTAPGGTLALIQMREDLLKLAGLDAVRAVLDQDFVQLFLAWFNRGFLQLRRIDWQTPALILEKLIEYESVHEIKGWPDLRRRLQQDRRCFGFFHPAIPDVPLIFVEVALTHGMSNNIKDLLQPAGVDTDSKPFDTAVFYSINNCLYGLRGVSFGNFLIKQVVEDLGLSNPHIRHFVTLSPVPGFMKWLAGKPESLQHCSADEQHAVYGFMQQPLNVNAMAAQPLVQQGLLKLCADYLLNAKSRQKPLDAVARFHLGNGARLERINWLADISNNGLQQSAGIMVNYVYDSHSLAHNHVAYEQRHEVIASQAVKKLLGG
ncbi:MAG TPA: malonyl-CoA decarboxylase family protein [Candidatus Acidoferrum sp.]|nr:malonyl-CoA decarboxylase family protein [Candidatus Acidoferrum sp.]